MDVWECVVGEAKFYKAKPRGKKRGVKFWAAIARLGRCFPSRKRVISACLLA